MFDRMIDGVEGLDLYFRVRHLIRRWLLPGWGGGVSFYESINLSNHTCFNSVNMFSFFICTMKTEVFSTGQLVARGPLKMSIVSETVTRKADI